MNATPRLFAVTLDCPEPAKLAAFYRGFLDGELFSSNDDFVALTIAGGVRLDFQRVANHQPPPWPDPNAPCRMHLDFAVDDLDQAERRLLDIGAALAEFQPGGHRFRVFLDPAGHPLCIATSSAATIGDEPR